MEFQRRQSKQDKILDTFILGMKIIAWATVAMLIWLAATAGKL